MQKNWQYPNLLLSHLVQACWNTLRITDGLVKFDVIHWSNGGVVTDFSIMRVGLYFWMSKDCALIRLDCLKQESHRESTKLVKFTCQNCIDLAYLETVCYATIRLVIWQNCGLWWLAFQIYLSLFSSKTFIRSGLLSQLSESAKINTMISSIIHKFGVPKDTSARWPSRKVLCINRQRLPEIQHLGNVKLWHIFWLLKLEVRTC